MKKTSATRLQIASTTPTATGTNSDDHSQIPNNIQHHHPQTLKTSTSTIPRTRTAGAAAVAAASTTSTNNNNNDAKPKVRSKNTFNNSSQPSRFQQFIQTKRKEGVNNTNNGATATASATASNGATAAGATATVSKSRLIMKTRKTNSSTFFSEELPSNELPLRLVQLARRTGVLNLSSSNLTVVPSKVWRINDIEEEERSATLNVSLNSSSGGDSDQKWWEFMELQKLIIANNVIREIPDGIGQLFSLTVLDAHDNKIETISSSIGFLENLTKLDLSHNSIKQLPEELYDLKLKELKLSHNSITNISAEIGKMATLNELDLSHNLITFLPGDIGFLSHLFKLDICNNKLQELPPDFCTLTGLRSLNASVNYISDVGSIFRDFNHLETLDLHQNKLRNLPILTNCIKLKEIHLRNNQITEFDSSIFASTKIQLLDLTENKISMIDINRNDLELVDRLYLENNSIATLPNDLAMLPALKLLTLQGNPLRGIRLDILKRGTVELLRYLRDKVAHLYAENNQAVANGAGALTQNEQESNAPVKTHSPRQAASPEDLGLDYYKLKTTKQLLIKEKISALNDSVFEMVAEAGVYKIQISTYTLTTLPTSFENVCPKLVELVLDCNKFQSLPICIGTTCPNMEYLSFQNNHISTLPPEFAGLRKLREINMGINKFGEIPACIFELPKLEILIANDNQIETIDVEGLRKLTTLAALNLNNNSIFKVPPQLGTLTNITSLSIEGNTFRVPGPEIRKKGTEATLQFLRNRILPV